MTSTSGISSRTISWTAARSVKSIAVASRPEADDDRVIVDFVLLLQQLQGTVRRRDGGERGQASASPDPHLDAPGRLPLARCGLLALAERRRHVDRVQGVQRDRDDHRGGGDRAAVGQPDLDVVTALVDGGDLRVQPELRGAVGDDRVDQAPVPSWNRYVAQASNQSIHWPPHSAYHRSACSQLPSSVGPLKFSVQNALTSSRSPGGMSRAGIGSGTRVADRRYTRPPTRRIPAR